MCTRARLKDSACEICAREGAMCEPLPVYSTASGRASRVASPGRHRWGRTQRQRQTHVCPHVVAHVLGVGRCKFLLSRPEAAGC